MRVCCIRICGRSIRQETERTLPVKGVGISALVKQDVAAVSLSQVFVNDGNKPIEVEYVFPIPSGGTLSALKIWLHGKVIQAQVKEKEEAKEQFVDALASGDNAFMAQISELEDLVTLQIGVIKAGEEVRVEVTYIVECKFEAGRWKMVIPLAMIPRYQSPERLSRGGVGQTWSFACSLETSAPVSDLRLSVKKFTTEHHAENLVVLKAGGPEMPKKDLCLSYTTAEVSAPFSLLQRDPTSGCLGLHFSFQPPAVSAGLEEFDPSGEFVLLLDRSGSMKGSSIETAKQAVELFIKSLPERSLFNILSFGSDFAKLFPESQAYSEASIASAIAKVKAFQANMGGTEIYRPLATVLRTEPKSSFPRYVFLITDGAVGNVQQVVDLVESCHLSTRVSTIGIGSGASSDLIERVAKAGHGSSTLILDVAQIKEGVLSSLEKSLQPSLNDVTVNWLSGAPIIQQPSKPFYAFNGERIAFNAILPDTGAPVAFRVVYFDSLTDQLKTFEFVNDLAQVSEGNQSFVLAVKGAEGTSDEVRLAVQFQVLTKQTGLIATCRAEGAPVDSTPQLVKVSLFNKQAREPTITMPRPGIVYRGMGGMKSFKGGFTSTSSHLRMNKAAPSLRKSGMVSMSRASSMLGADCDMECLSMPPSSAPARERTWQYEAKRSLTTLSAAEELINVQSPEGCWHPSAEILVILSGLSIDFAAVIAAHAGLSVEILATQLVCAVLTEKLSEFEGTWRLAAVKAVRWLRKQGAQKQTLSALLVVS
jgi:hypothetical protein